MNLFKNTENKQIDVSRETETLYSNTKQHNIIEGIELPKNWTNFSNDELKTQARNAILELSKSSNSDFKAKKMGFNNAEHLMQICFDFILK